MALIFMISADVFQAKSREIKKIQKICDNHIDQRHLHSIPANAPNQTDLKMCEPARPGLIRFKLGSPIRPSALSHHVRKFIFHFPEVYQAPDEQHQHHNR